jgi:hypothetical protein
MSDQDPDDRPLLERPVRSLMDVSIGTALKAYALWVIGGFVIAAIVALVLFGAFSTGGDTSAGGSSAIAIPTGVGPSVTLAQYRSVKPGTPKSAVVARLGHPTTTDDRRPDAEPGGQGAARRLHRLRPRREQRRAVLLLLQRRQADQQAPFLAGVLREALEAVQLLPVTGDALPAVAVSACCEDRPRS